VRTSRSVALRSYSR